MDRIDAATLDDNSISRLTALSDEFRDKLSILEASLVKILSNPATHRWVLPLLSHESDDIMNQLHSTVSSLASGTLDLKNRAVTYFIFLYYKVYK